MGVRLINGTKGRESDGNEKVRGSGSNFESGVDRV